MNAAEDSNRLHAGVERDETKDYVLPSVSTITPPTFEQWQTVPDEQGRRVAVSRSALLRGTYEVSVGTDRSKSAITLTTAQLHGLRRVLAMAALPPIPKETR